MQHTLRKGRRPPSVVLVLYLGYYTQFQWNDDIFNEIDSTLQQKSKPFLLPIPV